MPRTCYWLRSNLFVLSCFLIRLPEILDRYIVLGHSTSGSFNYDKRFRGTTEKPAPLLKQDSELAKDGFSVNCARVLVGSGRETFEKGKAALQNWRHFGLNWAFVDPKAQIQSGTKFCVCVKEFFPWLMMPLQVVYVSENKNSKKGASFSFGSGTLQGHLLAGEERFSIALDENDLVWYEILSFSKPAHLLSLFGYPYVLLRQKYFAHQSGSAVKKHLSA
ncbi:UPF0548 protein At2g17695 isoform X1 [Solanum lycopersicum]|uniref:UPF0548 protein At2g17695 isoform X1 n=1 Tax=Solanum lycopersicum TaxID=4081 RepID=UPI0002BCBC97|nr:UPF0548 protein At2g17695 isoform X1 [Solanum lycopersicum]XP_010316447.1 UPF0548 protein At2g17695 isoform X1 [Solanum lycopersicum]XP_025885279.1 UPF0548 protein At2g17695 isoform X1 [Solanum lycopersicum]